jgi:DNA end-binding protein Ku
MPHEDESAMARHPVWQGHLKLSLVTCPVALYSAVDAAGDVHFHLINPDTNNRIRMQTIDPDSGPVERSHLVKGYEVSKGEYVLLTDEEIRSVKLESTRTIDIDRFVPQEEIDRIYWDNPYYLAPDGKAAQEAFGVIREAMRRGGRVALGRIVMATRERILALEPRGKGILAYTLRADAEVRSSDEIFDPISEAKPDPAMIDIAEKIIAQRAGPFDPSTFVDRYEEALKAMIEVRVKGRRVRQAAEPQDTKVVDLMAALRASLSARSKAPAKAKTERQEPAPKRRSRGGRR